MVYANRMDPNVTREQIQQAYKDFHAEWEPTIAKVNERLSKR